MVRVPFGTEMQGRQKVAKFCKIFKNNFLKILKKNFFKVRQLIKIALFSFVHKICDIPIPNLAINMHRSYYGDKNVQNTHTKN